MTLEQMNYSGKLVGQANMPQGLEVPRPPSEMDTQLIFLRESVDKLHASISTLFGQLNSYTGQDIKLGNAEVASEPTSPPATCEATSQVRDLALGVQEAQERIEILLRTLRI